jgi:hypothetical protein
MDKDAKKGSSTGEGGDGGEGEPGTPELKAS